MLQLVVDNTSEEKRRMELSFDKEGILISAAQYATTMQEKKRILEKEMVEIEKRMAAVRHLVDSFHLLEVSKKGRLTFHERENQRRVRAEYGQLVRSLAGIKTLMGKWMYI